MHNRGISILVPTLNEKANISPLIKSLAKTLASHKITYEIIFVDDRSSDFTRLSIAAFKRRYPVSWYPKLGKRGRGYSIYEGFEYTLYDYIAVVDADNQAGVQAIPELLKLAEQAGFSRISPRGPAVFKREIFAHLPPKLVSAWNVNSVLVHTALELGYPGQLLRRKMPHLSRQKTLSIKLKRALEITKSKLTHAFSHPVFPLVPDKKQGQLGHGVAFRRRRFVVHTDLAPHLSAIRTFVPWQVVAALTTITFLVLGFLYDAKSTSIVLTSILSVVYLLDVAFNLFITLKSLHFPPELSVEKEEITRLNERKLPLYTVLCPLYHESKVLPEFIRNMQALDWPKDKLEILLLLEESDTETIKTARSISLPSYFRIIVVPDSHPKTKPKACNYGLAKARGEYIVVYDAEDQPDPLQLKKAYLIFSRSDSKIACLQAKLNYYNPHHNLLTRLFTAEYSLWFDVILPGLQSIQTTIPLGGTSNHFLTSVLKSLKGWDSFNVTEDADLGARLFSAGYKTAIIDSTTLEEANSDLNNWLRQRSRWLKGYMQTYLVHMRRPLTFMRQHGLHALIFQLVIGGKISFILINPILWLMTISYFLLYPLVGSLIEAIYPAPVFYMALTSLLIGNFTALYNYMLGVAKRGHWELVKHVYLIPLYWLGISWAAMIALYQLLLKPYYWEKTRHGLYLDHLAKRERILNSKIASKNTRSRKFESLLDFTLNAYKSGGVLVLAALFANVMNFFYNAYLSRRLALADFGDISLFGSFIYISMVPLSSLSRTVTHKSAYLFGKYGTPVKSLWETLKNKSFFLSLLVSLLWLIATPLTQRFFRVESPIPFILFAPVFMLATSNAISGGFLSGNLIFGVTALTTILESLSKLFATVLFVNLDYKEYVYASIPISLLVVMLIERGAVKKLAVYKRKATLSVKELALSKKFYLTSVMTSLTKAIYLSLDVMLAKHFLSPILAGAYSYLSLAGKMVFLLSSIFSQFLIPYASRDLGSGKSPKTSFRKLFLMISLVNAGAFLVFGLFGFVTAPLLWGSQAELIVRYLPAYTLAMALFSTSSSLITFEQVRGRHLFPVFGFILALLMGVGMYLEHHSIGEIVLVVSITSVISLVGILLLTKFYSFAVDLFHAFIDFIGLFRRIPRTPPLPNGKLRILIFNWRDLRHKWAGGAEVYLHELARRFVEDGNEVTIFSGNDGKSARFETYEGVKLVRRGGFYLVYFWAFVYYFFRLRGRYDVVLDSENGLPFFTPLYVKEPVFLLIHHVHQEVFRKSLPPPFSWLASLLERRVMPFVYRRTQVITVSPSSKADILLHKLTRVTPHIVYNGVDLEKCVPGKKALRPTVLYLGRLTAVKSVQVLLHATLEVLAHIPRVQVLIAGDGPARKSLVRLTKNLHLEKVVQFVGHVDEKEKIKLLSSAWVFVNPSLIEGWGITTIEANACGTPVIASNVAGLRDAVKNPHSGLLVPYGQPKEFGASITLLLKNHKMRAQMSKYSLAWAKKFDWDQSAQKAINILRAGLPRKYKWIKSSRSPGYPNLLLGQAKYKGNRIFVKSWLKPPKSALNEVRAYRLLSSSLKGRVKLPKLLFVDRSKSRLDIGLEYVEGKTLGNFPLAQQLSVYREVISALSSLPAMGTGIFARPALYLILSFPYLVFKALLVGQVDWRIIMQTSRLFLGNAHTLLFTKTRFVHRDLGLDNIMVTNNCIYLLDFQYAAKSLPEYELAGIWRSLSRDGRLSSSFLQEVKNEYCVNKLSLTRFKLMSIYYAVLGLTDSRHTEGRLNDFQDVIWQANHI